LKRGDFEGIKDLSWGDKKSSDEEMQNSGSG
jgi:hypothetical protein